MRSKLDFTFTFGVFVCEIFFVGIFWDPEEDDGYVLSEERRLDYFEVGFGALEWIVC